MGTYVPNQLYQVPLAELQPDPAQPRKYMDPAALEEMTASVGQVGIIEPVVCRQDPATGLCYVVAGERRCAASRKAGLPTVPAVFIDGGIGLTAGKIDDIDFPSFTEEDRAMLIETMNAMKDILEAAITRAVKNKKKPT